jgi:hypothetical protein
MGNPTFYVYYDDAGPLTVHDFGRTISDCYPMPTRSRVDSYGGDGAVSSMVGPAAMRVTLRRERTSDTSLVRMWRNVEDHLLVGGRVGFSWNHAKSWAGYASYAPAVGGTLLYTRGNGFSAWSASAALASGDEIVVETPNPEGRREYNTFSSINAANQITVGSAVLNTLSARALIRYAGFFPALFLPQDQLGRLRITGDRGITWDMNLELEVDQRIYALGYASTDTAGGLGALDLRGTGTLPGAAGRSLVEMLGSAGTGSAAARTWKGGMGRYGRI